MPDTCLPLLKTFEETNVRFYVKRIEGHVIKGSPITVYMNGISF